MSQHSFVVNSLTELEQLRHRLAMLKLAALMEVFLKILHKVFNPQKSEITSRTSLI